MLLALVVLMLAGCSAGVGTKESQTMAESQLELGVAYMEQERLDLARVHLEKALSTAPSRAEVHYALALLHLREENAELSEHHFRRSLERSTPYPEAQNGYGVLLCRLGRIDEALGYFQMAVTNPAYGTPEIANRNREICGEEMR